MLEYDLLAALAVKRNVAGQQFIQDDPERIDIDLFAVLTFSDFGCHVVECTNAFGLATAPRCANVLRQSVIADLDQSAVDEDVGGLEISVNNSLIV